ncbi:MAG: hypothetical protein AD742_13825 [Methylibium sp. NZG]|nr:MAG: hypothetical protein AD742_13825 [Methylibium sp. NZG]
MPPSTSPLPPPTPTERLRRMSRWMRGLIAAGALILVAVPAVFWSAEPAVLQKAAAELLPHSAAPIPITITPEVRLRILPVVAINVAVGLYALLQLWHLFGAYGRGVVFGPQASSCLRRLAWALMATALLRPLTQTVVVVMLTWHNPPGQRQLVIGLSWEDYLCLVFGGLLLAMSWAMVEARRLEQENAAFV